MKKCFTILAIIFSTGLFAQIPNGDFESWTNTSGYNTPDNWDNMNAMTSSMSSYTCMKGTPGSSGTAYLKLVTTSMSGMGVVPGIATCGVLNMTNMSAPSPMSGFACSTRPQSLAGNWQYMANGSDQGYVNVLLTKWNPTMMMRDTIAYSNHLLQGMVMSWGSFNHTLTYTSLNFPDTAFITLSASGSAPEVYSYLYVDTLRFEGSVAGTNGINDNNIDAKISVSPNPANDMITVRFDDMQTNGCAMQIINAEGQLVRSIETSHMTSGKTISVNVSDLAMGLYLIKISSINGVSTKRILIK
jgi:hypothetical protein